MSKTVKYIKTKFWARLYIRIAAILLVFVAILSLCNSTMLYKYYVFTEKRQMLSAAKKIDQVDLYSQKATEKLSEIIEDEQYNLLITDSFDNMLYTTKRTPVADFRGNFLDSETNSQSDRLISERFTLSGGEVLTLSLKESFLEDSAKTANRFIFYIAIIFLVPTLAFTLFSARKVTEPIGKMNEIANAMARLDFTKKINAETEDEIGQLANSINELSATLDNTLRDLENKNALLRSEIDEERRLDNMRKEFVANVSHELKTPIAIISGYAEGLKLETLSDTDRKEYLEVITDESARMNAMVLQLLELSRMQSGQNVLEEEIYDISEQLERVVKHLKLRYQKYDIECTASPLTVCADYRKIEEVINNYINNAVSHVSENGKVRITLEEAGDYAKISVYNDGKNIPTEDMEHIWDSFWRGETSHKREAERVGLGLSIVKTVMEIHGTSCGVDNTDGGVSFWFTVKKSSDVENKLLQNGQQ